MGLGCWRLYSQDEKFFPFSGLYPGHPPKIVSDTVFVANVEVDVLLRRLDGTRDTWVCTSNLSSQQVTLAWTSHQELTVEDSCDSKSNYNLVSRKILEYNIGIAK